MTFLNRWFALYLLVFFITWGTASTIAESVGLPTHFAVLLGIIAGDLLDSALERILDLRGNPHPDAGGGSA